MAKYAEGTEVPVEKSREEIARILAKYGATGFAYGYDGDKEVLSFKANNRFVRFDLKKPNEEEINKGKTWGRKLTGNALVKAIDAEHRRRWRCLALCVKAKLELVATGITTFEDEFLSHIVTPSGATVGTWLKPQLASAYETGDMPPLLPAHRGSE
jgi:hypothetical protein